MATIFGHPRFLISSWYCHNLINYHIMGLRIIKIWIFLAIFSISSSWWRWPKKSEICWCFIGKLGQKIIPNTDPMRINSNRFLNLTYAPEWNTCDTAWSTTTVVEKNRSHIFTLTFMHSFLEDILCLVTYRACNFNLCNFKEKISKVLMRI